MVAIMRVIYMKQSSDVVVSRQVFGRDVSPGACGTASFALGLHADLPQSAHNASRILCLYILL